jgi:hypothetical protein
MGQNLDRWTIGHFDKMVRRKKRRNRKVKALVSDKIEVNPNRLYRISDPLQMANVIFPQKNAKQLRAAFIAIYFTIRNDPHQKIERTEFLAEKFDLPLSAICKVRGKLNRMGIIKKQDGYWQFSNRFFTAIERFIDTLDGYRVQVEPSQKDAVFAYVEIAKNI